MTAREGCLPCGNQVEGGDQPCEEEAAVAADTAVGPTVQTAARAAHANTLLLLLLIFILDLDLVVVVVIIVE